MSDDLEDGYEQEGIDAFNRMAAAMAALQSRLGTLEHNLGLQVAKAEKTASQAATAASEAQRVVVAAQAVQGHQARSLALWVGCGVLGGMLAAGGAGYWLGQGSGWEAGQANGYRTAMDEKAAASWANTRAGQLAFALDRVGSLDQLARCNGQGWTQTVQAGRKACYPVGAGGKAPDGWFTP